MKLSPFPKFVVACDPGANTGVCFLRQRDAKVLFSGTLDFYSAQLLITKTFKDRSQVRIFVEHPPTFMYKRNDVAAGPIRDRKQQMQAANRREGELLALCLKGRGYDVHLVPPVHEKKWDQRRYTLYTGSNKRTSEHERDAVRLAVVHASWRPELKR